MKIRRLDGFVLVFVCLVSLAAKPASAAGDTISYRISLAQPQQHLFHVRVAGDVCRNGRARFELPAWNALYQIRDFAQYVGEFGVRDGSGQALAVEKVDKQSWEVTCSAGTPVEARYDIFWNESSPHGSQLDHRHAFINFADILMYLPAERQRAVSVEFEDVPAGWRMGTALEPGNSAGRFRAPSYDELVDSPVEVGEFDEWEFQLDGARYRVIVHADNRVYSREKMTRALEAIVRTETVLMRDRPFPSFTFIFHFLPDGVGGGMEHAYSTAIHISPEWMRDDALAFAGTAAHEFFHLWNVKRIRPQQLEPVDYSRENYTRALWFAEGGTSAYGFYTMLRSGLWDRKQFYRELGDLIGELAERPARRWKTLEEASLEAWLEKYRFYRRPDRSFSYYTRGAIVTVLLDLAIRDATDNRRSMDDVMRYLNEQFARQGRFYDDRRDIPAAVATIAGRNLDDFFRRFVSGSDEIPYDEFFRLVGLELRREEKTRGWLGLVVFRDASGLMVVDEVEPNAAADRAGLREGDILVSMDGERVGRDFDRKVRRLSPGRTVRLRFRRDEEEREVKMTVGGRAEATFRLEEKPDADARARRLREGWLAGRTD